jgi:hypothetical protein
MAFEIILRLVGGVYRAVRRKRARVVTVIYQLLTSAMITTGADQFATSAAGNGTRTRGFDFPVVAQTTQ